MSSAKGQHPKILCIGDSLTQTGWSGWVGSLADMYQRRADVINRGMSGYNTRWYLEYADNSTMTDVWALQPSDSVVMITICFGANDASDEGINPHHHVPLGEYKENMKTLIERCRKCYPRAALLLMTPPPVVHSQRLEYQRIRYGDKATGQLERSLPLSQKYADAAKEMALESNIESNAIIHLWNLMQQREDWESFFYDGLHFSSKGHEFVIDAIRTSISVAYPHLYVHSCPVTKQYANSASSCDAISQSGPYHDEIDHADPSRSFLG